tara:strand:+ start:230 stop:658 length:429 start_codon:yes stop_codon:yes gene_type:complete
MPWLKKFIKSVENNPKFNNNYFCNCGSCQAHWEAAIILNSSQKLKIKIPKEKIEIENSRHGNFAIKPIFKDISRPHADSFLNDLIDELSGYILPKPTRYSGGFTQNIQAIISSLIQVLIVYEKKKELKVALLYSPLSKIYNL